MENEVECRAQGTLDRIREEQRRHAEKLDEISREEIAQLYHDVIVDEISRLRKSLNLQFYGEDSAYGVMELINVVCEDFRVTPEELERKTRKKEIVRPRQVIAWMLKKKVVVNELPYEAIGKLWGQDHSTAIHGEKAINNMVETDLAFRERMMELCYKLNANVTYNEDEKEIELIGYFKKKQSNCQSDDVMSEE